MNSVTPNEYIADRDSIHKSCKTLEVVVNVLSDYCEAANAIVALQRRLVKALRDAAGVKCIPEIPANALGVSATIFDTLCDVDSKFVKLADKECDLISAEVKKWFKKLAKEERAHDARLANANAKIKQAGQLYEKKAKRNPQDAADEHARYMNILTTVGPEMNQEKYNHSLMVTRRHTSAIYSLAASLSRVADAEWLRCCEGVRRSAPTIGQLGEWRVYCEGGWTGALPTDLPAYALPSSQPDRSVTPVSTARALTPNTEKLTEDMDNPVSEKPTPEHSSRHPPEETSSRAVIPAGEPSPASPQYNTSPDKPPETSSHTPLAPKTTADDTVRSLVSLSSFPDPPSHFPMPPLARNEVSSPVKEARPESPRGPRTPSEIIFPRKTDSPTPLTPSEPSHSLPSPVMPHTELRTVTSSPKANIPEEKPGGRQTSPMSPETNERRETRAPSSVLTRSSSKKIAFESISSGQASSYAGSSQSGEHAEVSELGVLKRRDEKQGHQEDAIASQILERTDTGMSSGSVVAALRDKYSRNPEQPISPRKEVPRLATNVSKIATRYESIDANPTSPRLQPTSAVGDRRLSMDISRGMAQTLPTDRRVPGTSSTSHATYTIASDEVALRRQRIAELEELELREQELELRRKEREVEQRARALEQERARILNARSPDSGYGSENGRSGIDERLSISQQSNAYSGSSSTRPRYTQHSYNTPVLDSPRTARPSSSQHTASQPISPLHPSTEHAPYCGCQTCSASKYATRDSSPTPMHVRPIQPPIQLRPEKPKGWIRRLSMPVMGNAFSLDSKKNVSSAGIAGGPGYRSSLALPDENGMLRKDITGGIRNRSATNLERR